MGREGREREGWKGKERKPVSGVWEEIKEPYDGSR